MLYCTYDTLNMFRALLCPSSGGRDYRCITAYGVLCLVAGCRRSGAGTRLYVQEEGCCTTESCNIPLPGRIACCPAPDPPTTSNQALHTTGGSNTHTVSSSWWWTQKCPKHVQHIISAINHSVASSWFFFSTLCRGYVHIFSPRHVICLENFGLWLINIAD